MKCTKRFAALLLALVMTLALSIPALADEGAGSITVKNAVTNADYTIYRLFDLESYNATSGAYAYTVNTKWSAYFKDSAEGLNYFDVDESGYVTAKENMNAAEFAQKALAYAEANSIANDGTAKGNDGDLKFENLALGYYLVDSSVGALCALTTTDPDGEVIEKNSAPSLEKQVKEDSTGNWGDENDADIGQTVEFKATITVQGYAKGYVMHDKMDDGLTYSKVSKVTLNGNDVTADNNYTVKTSELTDGCTFEVVFTDTFCNTLKSGDVIVVYYEATLNSNAVVAAPENNKAHLSYTDNSGATKETEDDTTKTYTWDVDVLKYANGVESNVLSGAEFVLLKKVEGTEYFAVVDENGKLTGWTTEGVKPATDAGEEKTYATVLTTNDIGKIEIDGLDADTYYLREIKAPEGYNKLANDVEVVITGATKGEGENDTLTYTTVVAKVNNQSGTELPSTGGMGTTVLYVLGAALVLCAGVLLVTRRRMSR